MVIMGNWRPLWPLWGIFSLPKLPFLKTELSSHASEIVPTARDAYFDWYFEASKYYQESKITSLQDTMSRLRQRQKGFWGLFSLFCLQTHCSHLIMLTPHFWCHHPPSRLHLLDILVSPFQLSCQNSRNLSLSLSLLLWNCPFKLNFLSIQINPKYLLFSWLRLDLGP